MDPNISLRLNFMTEKLTKRNPESQADEIKPFRLAYYKPYYT